jgi:predicted CDP-diglyceride synthetase/phosphatidate cytidylyltransferase
MLSLIYPLHKSLGHAKSSQSSFIISWQWICNTLTVTTAHIKSSFCRLIPLYSFNSHSHTPCFYYCTPLYFCLLKFSFYEYVLLLCTPSILILVLLVLILVLHCTSDSYNSHSTTDCLPGLPHYIDSGRTTWKIPSLNNS